MNTPPLTFTSVTTKKFTFSVKGDAEVHLSGYFEPDHGDDEDMYGDYPMGESDEDDEEIEDEDDEEEEKPAAKKPVTAAPVAAK